MNRHTLYFNLHDALNEEGCPICRLRSQAMHHYLKHLLYESVNDLDVRESIRRSHGFCTEHAWQLQQKGDALGIAIIHQDVISNISRALSGTQQYRPHSLLIRWVRTLLHRVGPEAARQLTKELAPRGECPACQKRTEVEQAYLETLLQHYTDPELLALLHTSDGLCWPHLQRALQLVRDETALRLLVETELAHFERLRDELGEFIRRHDHQWGTRGFGSERDSWLRATAKVSGWHHQP